MMDYDKVADDMDTQFLNSKRNDSQGAKLLFFLNSLSISIFLLPFQVFGI